MPLADRPMVEWSLAAFRAVGAVRSIVVACPPGHVHELGGHDLGVVEGGETRSASVANALTAVGTELVAIHDAARPLVTPQLIEGVIGTLLGDPAAAGAIAAAPVTNTIKRAAPAAAGSASSQQAVTHAQQGVLNCPIVVEETVDRGQLWAAQTPQVFRTEALRGALAAWYERVESDTARIEAATGDAAPTDEAMLVEAAGGKVLIHPAPPENLKVTTPLDLRVAELLLAQ